MYKPYTWVVHGDHFLKSLVEATIWWPHRDWQAVWTSTMPFRRLLADIGL